MPQTQPLNIRSAQGGHSRPQHRTGGHARGSKAEAHPGGEPASRDALRVGSPLRSLASDQGRFPLFQATVPRCFFFFFFFFFSGRTVPFPHTLLIIGFFQAEDCLFTCGGMLLLGRRTKASSYRINPVPGGTFSQVLHRQTPRSPKEIPVLMGLKYTRVLSYKQHLRIDIYGNLTRPDSNLKPAVAETRKVQICVLRIVPCELDRRTAPYWSTRRFVIFLVVGQNSVLVNIKIGGKWMFIHPRMEP